MELALETNMACVYSDGVSFETNSNGMYCDYGAPGAGSEEDGCSENRGFFLVDRAKDMAWPWGATKKNRVSPGVPVQVHFEGVLAEEISEVPPLERAMLVFQRTHRNLVILTWTWLSSTQMRTRAVLRSRCVSQTMQ